MVSFIFLPRSSNGFSYLTYSTRPIDVDFLGDKQIITQSLLGVST